MEPRTSRPSLIAAGVALLLGLLIAAGYIASTLWPRVVVIEQRAVDTPRGSINPKPGIQPFDKLIDQVCSAIVTIAPPAPDASADAQPDATAPAPAMQSGFLVSPDGLIATAAQNIGTANSVTVTLEDGRRFTALSKGADELTGVALLAIQPDPGAAPGTLPFLQFATTSASRIGQWVLSVQAPAGAGCAADLATISADSIVSGDRHGNYLVLRPDLETAAIGAPLFNVEGRVVGIVGLGAPSATPDVRIALPASVARLRIDGIEHGGQPAAGYGVAVDDLNPVIAERFGTAQQSGAYVALVAPGSAADAAGLAVGDVIVTAGGQPVPRASALTPLLAPPPGSTTLTLLRHGQSMTVTLPSTAPAAAKPASAPVKTGKNRGSRSRPHRR